MGWYVNTKEVTDEELLKESKEPDLYIKINSVKGAIGLLGFIFIFMWLGSVLL